MNYMWYEATCPVCRKKFIPHDGWAYKLELTHGNKLFCSWHCLRSEESGRKGDARQSKNELCLKILELLNEGNRRSRVAKILGISPTTVSYWADRYELQED